MYSNNMKKLAVDFWRLFNKTEGLGNELRDIERENRIDKEKKISFNKGRDLVQSQLKDVKQLEFIIQDQPMKYDDKILFPLQNNAQQIKLLDPFSPLHNIDPSLSDELLLDKWKAKLQSFLDLAIVNDAKEGGYRAKTLEAGKVLEKMEDKVDDKMEDIEQESKNILNNFREGLNEVKQAETEPEAVNHTLEGAFKKLYALRNDVDDIRVKQNKRIDGERRQTLREGREITKVKTWIRKSYGDNEAMKKALDEFTDVKKKQEERINRDKFGMNYGNEINKLRGEVNLIWMKQMERLKIEGLGLQEKRDQKQDEEISKREKKDEDQDQRIRSLEKIISELQGETKYLKGRLEASLKD